MRNDLKLSAWKISSTASQWHDDFLESIFFLGNGRMGIRGYLPFESEYRPTQKGLFVAGIFGEIKPGITDFVNLPTPVWANMHIDGQPVQLSCCIVRELDMYSSSFNADFMLTANGKTVDVSYQRFFPKYLNGLCLQRYIFKPNASLFLQFEPGIEITSCNSPIPDDQTKENTETVQLAKLKYSYAEGSYLTCSFEINGTSQTVTETTLFAPGIFQYDSSNKNKYETYSSFSANIKENEALTFDLLTSIQTSRDIDSSITAAPVSWDYDDMFKKHCSAWSENWKHCDFCISVTNTEAQCALRYNMFQLMGNCSSKDPTVSIGARGLTHTRYKGCYFWDTDIFMLPFFLENDPEAARNLCEYRVRTLPSAKKYAQKMNCAGARYPWMASLDGSEQCETWDIGCSEVHITADVAYSISQYCSSSGDEEFYLEHASEVFIETARYWISRYTYDSELKEANLLFCKGPDEYCGITSNNLYTNVMVQYNLELAIHAAKALKEKRPQKWNEFGLSQDEVNSWNKLHDAIPWPRDPKTGRLTEDDTFHLLEPVDISRLKLNDEASYYQVCFDRLQRYKVVKQADVLLLMTRLPERFSEKEKLSAWLDFEPICLHDSTLSFASHALFAAQNKLLSQANEYLHKALFLDLRDIMGNTGKEGLHLANMGEVWQAARFFKDLHAAHIS